MRVAARYRAKVVSRGDAYPRRDAIVVYLPEESWRHVPDLARLVQRHVLAHMPDHPVRDRHAPVLAEVHPPLDRPIILGLPREGQSASDPVRQRGGGRAEARRDAQGH